MDKLGLQHQFLPPQIRPLSDDMVVFGRAMPVLEADIHGESTGPRASTAMKQPIGLMFQALDDLKTGRFTSAPAHLHTMLCGVNS